MKTLKTQRGIEFDLEITEQGNRSVEVMATCEYGEKLFAYVFDYNIDNLMQKYIDTESFKDLLSDEELQEIETWVDSQTIGAVVGELATVCIEKSINGESWTYSTDTVDGFKVTVIQSQCTGAGMFQILDRYNASGLESVQDLVILLRGL